MQFDINANALEIKAKQSTECIVLLTVHCFLQSELVCSRWLRGQCARRTIAEAKQRLQR
jgi:hypothetical protein